MTVSIFYTTTLVGTDCGECGIPFGMPTNIYNDRRNDGRNFWCPNGHKIAFLETENARLNRLLRQERDSRARAVAARDQAEASRRAWKGQATRARNKVLAGQCPFCGQHLRDLERHVSRQHADEAAKPVVEPIE